MKLKFQVNQKRKNGFIGLLGLLLTCFCVLSGFLFSKTEDYFLDNIATNINNVMEHYSTGNFIPSEINITKNVQTTRNDKRYPDLYAKYYYTSLVSYIFQNLRKIVLILLTTMLIFTRRILFLFLHRKIVMAFMLLMETYLKFTFQRKFSLLVDI